ncbi:MULTISPECIES: glycogen synthase GlgA [unclassified Cupriavidus]|uniref:glycogen synthase GlgA n=1 Tax=unclassified Cupriavidus TaxID=2640874 RepID=UPI001C0045CE|nr:MULTISPECIES: glycogen synthase GlgA [unclassified Cupriavidus]MCA3184802.1 glycogen synthase GlgA [Cupriavidus sp.]MCA3188709.1 glycogen synthase GlgA [Cupriavidus sp.]MCA3199725.1 glycogen synthase GlgA [Cupriavidus sp.]MCA3205199.1 glycogen synthase GlgA [Cupriavidus sp.]MCA3205819.1 glycogen synthase GlgA [Cupriavidus sp.]
MNANTLFVAAEAQPLAKTGGLADVVGGLAQALLQRGADVSILMPGYPRAVAAARDVRSLGAIHLPMALPPGHSPARLLQGLMPDSGVRVIFLDCPSLYDRPGSLYVDATGRDFCDNAQRFAALAHAAAAIAAGETPLPVPSLVHAHDWHAGLTPLLMHARGLRIPTVCTIHNLAFQGVFPMTAAEPLGLPPQSLTPDGIEFWGKINFLKAGIRYADRVTTVSHTYAREILTPHFGHGLDGLLTHRASVLGAIPNGVDTDAWSPRTDRLLPQRYDVRNMTGKRACKAALQARHGLPVDATRPLIAMGSRLTHQKMADVALDAIAMALATHADAQFVVLGCGDPKLEAAYSALAQQHPDRVGVAIGYREEDAHLLHAGADMLLHGSRFEPFGLTPVYAMRYGTVPIVSRVGGLADTVRDVGDDAAPAARANGIVFDGETAEAMCAAMTRGLGWYGRQRHWRSLQRTGMQTDFGWEGPARQYMAMYGALAPDLARVPVPVAAPVIAPVIEPVAAAPAARPARGGRRPVAVPEAPTLSPADAAATPA